MPWMIKIVESLNLINLFWIIYQTGLETAVFSGSFQAALGSPLVIDSLSQISAESGLLFLLAQIKKPPLRLKI